MKESINNVFIEGYLNKNGLEIKEKNGKTFIAGELEIRLDETNIVPVEVFANEKKKDGGDNPVFKGLVTVMKEYKDATKVESWEQAEKVRVSNGFIRVNDFVGRDNQVASAVKYNTNFVNRVQGDFEPKATFKTEIIVKAVVPEIKNDEETGRGFLDGFIVTYGGNVAPVRFTIPKKMFSKMEDNLEPMETLLVWGNIVSTVETREIIEEADFGEDNKKVITAVKKERLITGAKRVENGFESEEIKAAFKKRNEYLEDLKTKKLFSEEEQNNKQNDEEKMPWED